MRQYIQTASEVTVHHKMEAVGQTGYRDTNCDRLIDRRTDCRIKGRTTRNGQEDRRTCKQTCGLESRWTHAGWWIVIETEGMSKVAGQEA